MCHVTEEQLQRAGEIPTDLGGDPLMAVSVLGAGTSHCTGHGRTQVLYGDRDALTSRTMIERFRQESGAHLTIMEAGNTGSTPQCRWRSFKRGKKRTFDF